LHVELRVSLRARRKNLVVCGKLALLRYFDLTVIPLSDGQSLIESECFLFCRRAILGERGHTPDRQKKKEAPTKDFQHRLLTDFACEQSAFGTAKTAVISNGHIPQSLQLAADFISRSSVLSIEFGRSESVENYCSRCGSMLNWPSPGLEALRSIPPFFLNAL
jgi:hypothetical protein